MNKTGLVLLSALAGMCLSALPLAGQEVLAGDDTIPAALTDTAATGGGGGSPLSMGLYVELTSDNKFLTRDIATGETAGYEYDASTIYSKANWWFWGNLGNDVLLDAEISLWDATRTIYQSNSYAGSVADVTVADGLQGLAGMLFAPLYGLNGDAAPSLNKLKIDITSPWVDTAVGYGEIGDSKLTELWGIFHVIDYWDDVEKGFWEVRTGKNLRDMESGLHLDVLGGLSRSKDSYGTYAYARIGVNQLLDVFSSVGSTSTAEELFRYDEAAKAAWTVYAAFNPIKELTIEAHGLMDFGTHVAVDLSTMAGAARIKLALDGYTLSLMQSYAGAGASTVWGDDSSIYIDSLHSRLDQNVRILNGLDLGLLADLAVNGAAEPGNGLVRLLAEPMVDVNLKTLAGIPLITRLYGILQLDRIALAEDAAQPLTFGFSEAGLEIEVPKIQGTLESLFFDYAIVQENGSWNSTDQAYDPAALYNTFAFSLGLTPEFAVTAAAAVRTNLGAEDPAYVPVGFALGASCKTGLAAMGAPKAWVNFTFGMDPYKSDNTTIYLYSDSDNAPTYRSYRLVDLYDAVAESRIGLGLVWDLK